MRSSSLFWGSVLIIAGGLFLLSNMGFISFDFWDVFWPLVIIALGIWTLAGLGFRKNLDISQVRQPLEGATRARLRLLHGAGRLNISSGAAESNIVEGSFRGGVSLKSHIDGEYINVELNTPTRTAFPIFWLPGEALNWDVHLAQGVPINLELEMGANEVRLDLSELMVVDLRIKSGANSAEINLPANAGHTHAFISCGAASFRVRVPGDVAARIRYSAGLASVTVDTKRFPRAGGFYQSPDYESAENKVDLVIETGVGSVVVS